MVAIAGSLARRHAFERILSDEPRFTLIGLMMIGLAVPTLALMGLDNRTLQGENLWVKPLKFELSIGLFLLTLAFFARYLPDGMTDRKDYKAFSTVVVVCAVAEMVWIAGAASFGVASHFNTGPTMSQVYGFMGLVAVILTSAALVYGLAILGSGDRSPIVLAVAISLIMTFFLTIIVAFRLAGNGGHFIGDLASQETVPLLGWSRDVGDLRVPHFFATHAMQLVPLMAVALSTLAKPLMTRGTAIGLSVGYCLFTLATFLQALSGRPFLS